MVDSRVLAHDDVREADIGLYERRIWRVIDVREKINHPFAYPPRPFFQILLDAALAGDIKVYSNEDDQFTYELTPDEVRATSAKPDTIVTFDPDTYEETTEIVVDEINPEDVKRFRIKEVWFFDKESSTMQVRILGIAPILDEVDADGNFLFENVLFWVYYPDARDVLAQEQVVTGYNDSSPLSWDDILQMRYFSSYVYKESNVKDLRIKDYAAGIDILLEGERIKADIFNFEHDLWSY